MTNSLEEYKATVEKMMTLQFDLINEGYSTEEIEAAFNAARNNAIKVELAKRR